MASPSRSRPLLISFSGMDGSGKSTQIEALRSSLEQSGQRVFLRAFWDNVVAFPKWRAGFSHKFLKSDGKVGAPGKPANRNDKNNRSPYLLAGRSGLYLLDAVKLRRAIHRARSSQADVVIFDRYIYDQLATLPLERSWFRAYASLVLRMVPRPDVAFVLDAIPEAARERKPEYPLDFLYKYRESYLILQRMAGLTLIPALSQDHVGEEIANHVRKTVQGGGMADKSLTHAVS
ncbi:MAG: thymidylate kinase [Acidobacteriales bacterium]|nr:thymidylate kinase [Terriglobales bacterium]